MSRIGTVWVMQFSEDAKAALDFVGLAVVFSTLADWLPPLAAMASLVWSCIRIYETETVQRLLRRLKRKKECT